MNKKNERYNVSWFTKLLAIITLFLAINMLIYTFAPRETHKISLKSLSQQSCVEIGSHIIKEEDMKKLKINKKDAVNENDVYRFCQQKNNIDFDYH